MLNIFKKKSKIDKLNKQYEKLMAESHKLSTINRRASDEKYAEANRILDEIEKMAEAAKN